MMTTLLNLVWRAGRAPAAVTVLAMLSTGCATWRGGLSFDPHRVDQLIASKTSLCSGRDGPSSQCAPPIPRPRLPAVPFPVPVSPVQPGEVNELPSYAICRLIPGAEASSVRFDCTGIYLRP